MAAGLAVLAVAAVLVLPMLPERRSAFLDRPALPYQPISAAEVGGVLLPNAELPPLRQRVTDSAVLLNGRVSYFWGGKSDAIGFDPAWGEPRVVESRGSETTGQTLPYGMDCSGFLTWCFVQSGISFEQAKRAIGNGSENQWKRSYKVEWENLLPGDFVFQHRPGGADGNHVGIVLGFDGAGEPVIAHCSYSLGGCVITGRGDIFIYARRPYYYEETEGQ